MKIKNIIVAAVVSLLGLNSTYANSKVIDNLNQTELFTYHGNLKLTNSKLNTAEIQGSNHLYNNDFNGTVNINGHTDVKENRFVKSLLLMGDIKSENNIFQDRITIHGNIKDKESHFLSDVKVIGKASFDGSEIVNKIDIDSNEIKFTNSKVNSIIFSNKEDSRVINLYLAKNTTIKGDIFFSNAKGKIHMDPTVVIQGTINGGEVIR